MNTARDNTDTRSTDRAIAIRLRKVEKTFGKGESAVRALRGIDLDIPAGELTMLVGPSGCGKTTLISILAGLLSRDAGDMTVFGTDLATLRRDRLAAWRRDNVGFIFQQFNLVPQLTVAENVSVPRGRTLRRSAATRRDCTRTDPRPTAPRLR